MGLVAEWVVGLARQRWLADVRLLRGGSLRVTRRGGGLRRGNVGLKVPRIWHSVSAHFPGVGVVLYEHMFGTAEGTVDQARERDARRVGASCCRLCEQERASSSAPRRSCARPTTRRLGGGGLLVQCAVARTALEQRLPHRAADHAHEQRAARPAGARPRAEHRLAHARPGRSRDALRDPRERCRDRAPRGRQAAERDLARGAHDRPAQGGRRPGAVRSGARSA